MRRVFAGITASLALCAVPVLANDVEVKGPHICCKQCINVAKKVLSTVEGVSEVEPDAKTKTVKFKAKDDAAAVAGFKALVDGGFFGTATNDGKELKPKFLGTKAGVKADVVTVKNVHVCCGQCQTAVKKIFDGAKVTFDGKGPQRTVRIEGAGLDTTGVLEALRMGGFNGKVE